MIKRYRIKYNLDGIPCLKDVNNFINVYFHIGNRIKDTKACFLVGSDYKLSTIDGKEKQIVLNSTSTFKRFHKLISETVENIFVTVLNES